MGLKVIITGATGMVGEGLLLECLGNNNISEVLIVSRRHYELSHPKLKELIVPDFFRMEEFAGQLKGYDACFFCAGVSSVGMNEERYTYITYDTTLHVAQVLSGLNPGMVFTYVSGTHTDSSEKGKVMWARVKGRTENALTRLPFKEVYNFRPGFMKPVQGQRNVRWFFKPFIWTLPYLIPSQMLTLNQVGKAMIHAVRKGYPKQVLEIKDIKELARIEYNGSY